MGGEYTMKLRENRELWERIVGPLRQPHQREGIHVTDLTGCLDRAYWSRVMPRESGEAFAVTVSIGRWIHEALGVSVFREMPVEKDGIIGRIDFILDKPVEVKTTMSERIMPEWIEQIMAYAYMYGVKEYYLVVVRMRSKRIECYTLEFTDEELRENWEILLSRKERLLEALEKREPPKYGPPGWRCKECPYRDVCEIRNGNAREPEIWDIWEVEGDVGGRGCRQYRPLVDYFG